MFLTLKAANLGDAATTLVSRCATKVTAVSLISRFCFDYLAVRLAHRLDLCASASYVPHVSLFSSAFGMFLDLSIVLCLQVAAMPHDDQLRVY
jgi:hypothetical protein